MSITTRVVPRLRCPLALVSAGALSLLACGDADPPGELATMVSALTVEQCDFFEVDGKVQVCHRTSAAKSQYVIVRLSHAGCVDGHVGHVGDYISSTNPADPHYDPSCEGQGCFPLGAPEDPAQGIPCCDGMAYVDGHCAVCPPGAFGVEGRCSPCAPGTFQEEAGQTSCEPCSDPEDLCVEGVCDPTTGEWRGALAGSYFPDDDVDGYGDAFAEPRPCPEPGDVSNSDDCDDADANISPAAAERCGNQVDDDCNGVAEEGCGPFDLCMTESDDLPACTEAGGVTVLDTSCPTFEYRYLSGCESAGSPCAAPAVGQPWPACPSGTGCFTTRTDGRFRCLEDRCPDYGDTLVYTAVGGAEVDLHNTSDGRHYDCLLIHAQATFDCVNGPQVGDQVVVVSLGIFASDSACHREFNVGVTRGCTYRCSPR